MAVCQVVAALSKNGAVDKKWTSFLSQTIKWNTEALLKT